MLLHLVYWAANFLWYYKHQELGLTNWREVTRMIQILLQLLKILLFFIFLWRTIVWKSKKVCNTWWNLQELFLPYGEGWEYRLDINSAIARTENLKETRYKSPLLSSDEWGDWGPRYVIRNSLMEHTEHWVWTQACLCSNPITAASWPQISYLISMIKVVSDEKNAAKIYLELFLWWVNEKHAKHWGWVGT